MKTNYRRRVDLMKRIALGALLTIVLTGTAGGMFYVNLQSYLHHNPDNTMADFLYGERKPSY